MLAIRKGNERGHADYGWLNTFHTFSFGEYFDTAHMGYSSLRVINEDRVQPGEGFGTHPHRDMEIITYVLDGALEHKDSMGNGSVIRPGDIQYMSAGTGVTHSEFNPSQSELVHFLQIWILPNERGHKPHYDQRHFDADEKRGQWLLLASPDGEGNSIAIQQDAHLYARVLTAGEQVEYHPPAGRRTFLHVACGDLQLNGQPLAAGDGARIHQEATLRLVATTDAEVLLFDLA
ncbi:MAG TPA: pirin family protein [Stenomitos sp.]